MLKIISITILFLWTSWSESKITSRHYDEDIKGRSISIVGDQFMLDGKPLVIMSGSLHYFRVPAVYWRDRLHKLKAAGLNAVSTYVEWSFHEPEERQYQWSGDHDVAKFIQIAAEEGLLVLLRPGPYICGERDLGGLPYWLLGKYPEIHLRSPDKDFINETSIWMAQLFQHITPLLYGNGGPIILVQVENEYGHYGSDSSYKIKVRDILKTHVNVSAMLYTTDSNDIGNIKGGAVAETLTTVDFHNGFSTVEDVFKTLRKFMPSGPLMNSEIYAGWLTHWSEAFCQIYTSDIVDSLKKFLDGKINFNMYMFFGGTNFGFSSGANTDEPPLIYQPTTTSYDYDAPLNEAGDPTPKYNAIRKLMEQYFPELKNITPPTPSPKGAYGNVTVSLQFDLLSTVGRTSSLCKKYDDVIGDTLPTFEQLRQNAGLMLYEIIMNHTFDNSAGILEIKKPRDRVYVYIDGEYKGVIHWMSTNNTHLPVQMKTNSKLSLLVENQGRINYGSHLRDFKGILGHVTFNKTIISGKWTILGYPLAKMDIDVSSSKQVESAANASAALYKGDFVLPKGHIPLDTFLNTAGWRKGYVWINGHNLGRYWPGPGPMVTLYVPGAWLKAAPAHNTLHILELEQPARNFSMTFIDHPVITRYRHIH